MYVHCYALTIDLEAVRHGVPFALAVIAIDERVKEQPWRRCRPAIRWKSRAPTLHLWYT